MAFNGYLLKVGNYTIPLEMIAYKSYKPTYNSQDLDSYRDANGVLHREALPNFVPKVEFNVVAMLTNAKLASFLGNIRANYIQGFEAERKVSASVYIPEIDDYVTSNMYLSDFTPEIYNIEGNVIHYNSFRMAFIGYGD